MSFININIFFTNFKNKNIGYLKMSTPTQNACLNQKLAVLTSQGNTILQVTGQIPQYTVTYVTPANVTVTTTITVLSGACISTGPLGIN